MLFADAEVDSWGNLTALPRCFHVVGGSLQEEPQGQGRAPLRPA